MSKISYNGTATGATSDQIAPANASRTSFFFRSLGDVFVLNFGASATASDVLTVGANESIELDLRSPYDLNKSINVYCANASDYEAQAEEMSV